MQENYIVWRPSATEQKPPANPFTNINCSYCSKDNARRIDWNDNCGSIKDWLETLQGCNTIADCINWWDSVNNIRWDIGSFKELARAYVDYLSNLVSVQTWGRHSSRRFSLLPSII